MGQPFGFVPPPALPLAVPAVNGIVATGGLLGGAVAGAKAGAYLGPKGAVAGALVGALLFPLFFPDPAQTPGLPEAGLEPQPLPGAGLDPGLNPPETVPPVVPGNPTWFAGLAEMDVERFTERYAQTWCGGDPFGFTGSGTWGRFTTWVRRFSTTRYVRVKYFGDWFTGRSCTADESYDYTFAQFDEYDVDGNHLQTQVYSALAGLRGPSTWYGKGDEKARLTNPEYFVSPEIPEPGEIPAPDWDPEPAPDPDPRPRPLPIVPQPLESPANDPEVTGPIVEPSPDIDPLTAPSPDNPDAPPIEIPLAPPAEPLEVPDQKPGPSPLPYPLQPGVVPLPQPVPGVPPFTEPTPDPDIQPAPQPAPNPDPVPGPVPIPGPGTTPGTNPEPNQIPGPLVPGAPGPGPITTPQTPENPWAVDPGTGIVPVPAPGPKPTPPGHHFPVPGGPPVTEGGTRKDIAAIAAEVGRIEQKVAGLQNGSSGGHWDKIWPILAALEGFLTVPILGKDYYLQGVCESVPDGEPQPFEKFTAGTALNIDSVNNRIDQIALMLQQHLAYKTPICSGGSQRGDWRTISFISDELSPGGKRRLDKRFRYRSQSGLELSAVVDHWAGFTWQAGPVVVKHDGAWWGSPRVWAASIDEGKRVLRHAAREAGLDPDQTGRWEISGSGNPRLGAPGTMRVNTKGGYYWVTARDGSDERPVVTNR